MSELVERIERKLKERNITFGRLEHECGLGNGTIKRWNTQSPRLNRLVRVAEYLQVSLDYLTFGEKAASSEVPEWMRPVLTERESEGLSMFRGLPPEEQEDFYAFLQIKHKRYQDAAQPPEGGTEK